MPGDPAMGSSRALKVDDERFTPTRQPETRRNRATNRPVIAPELHHTTFTTKRLDEMVAWYELAVGLVPAFSGEDAAWLTNDEANHRIALLPPPGLKHPGGKGHTTGIHHTAFEFSTFDQWLDNYIRLRDHGIPAVPDARSWHHHVGEARSNGLTFREIHQKARAGEYLPGEIPQDIFLPELY